MSNIFKVKMDKETNHYFTQENESAPYSMTKIDDLPDMTGWLVTMDNESVYFTNPYHYDNGNKKCDIKVEYVEPLNQLGTFGEPEENPNGTGLKYDAEKPMYNLIPPVAINSLAEVMTFGARKYQPNSWQNVENGLERYRAALLRHVFAIQRGELVDPESGLNHSAHALACAAFINELENMESK